MSLEVITNKYQAKCDRCDEVMQPGEGIQLKGLNAVLYLHFSCLAVVNMQATSPIDVQVGSDGVWSVPGAKQSPTIQKETAEEVLKYTPKIPPRKKPDVSKK